MRPDASYGEDGYEKVLFSADVLGKGARRAGWGDSKKQKIRNTKMNDFAITHYSLISHLLIHYSIIYVIMITHRQGVIMKRTQIQITSDQARWLKKRAAEENVSMAEIIRISLDRTIQKEGFASQGELRRRAIKAAGALQGPPDLASKHDQHLSEAYQQ